MSVFKPVRIPSVLFALTFFMCGISFADTIFFKDGRFYTVPRVVPTEQGFLAHYDHHSIFVREELVKDTYIEQVGDQEPVGTSPEDAKRIAKGLVPFDGKWIPRTRRDQLLTKRNAEAQEKMDEVLKHQNWRDRYKKETKHFEFEFTVPEEKGDEFMEMFEVYYEVFAKEWKIKQPKGKKLKVCFYNNDRDFQRIGNVPRGVLGYFRFVEPLELNFFYERRDERLTLDVLFHELNHYLYHLFCKGTNQLAPWVEEGMAEYYGASKWDASSKKMTVGHPQEGRLVNLIDEMDGGNFQDLRALMSESNINATQYAWSWTLCHMLMQSPKYKSKFIKYIKKLAQDSKVKREPNPRNMNFRWVPVDVAIPLFQKSLGIKDLDAFEQEWYDYIKKMEVKTARGYHRAAIFCQRWDRPLRAAKYFKTAIDEHYSKNPDTYLAYGLLLVSEDKGREAIEVLEKGINLDPLNPDMWHALARAHKESGGDENEQKAKKYFLLAIEMDPYDPSLLQHLDSETLAELEG